MFKPLISVVEGIDKTNELRNLLNKLGNMDVLVGIPEGTDDSRKDASGLTNSELLYAHTHGIRSRSMRAEMKHSGATIYSQAYSMFIQTHGSPLWQVPPRPVIEPAIDNGKESIAKQLQKVIQSALDGKDPTPELEKAGMIGQNMARAWFTNPDNGWAPNAPSTIRMKGSDRPLIDTGEMRKAITYVVRREG